MGELYIGEIKYASLVPPGKPGYSERKTWVRPSDFAGKPDYEEAVLKLRKVFAVGPEDIGMGHSSMAPCWITSELLASNGLVVRTVGGPNNTRIPKQPKVLLGGNPRREKNVGTNCWETLEDGVRACIYKLQKSAAVSSVSAEF